MSIYPIKQINESQWKKKVECTAMYTIPAEDDAFPVLQELQEILKRLIAEPIQKTIDKSLTQYFFANVFPNVCQKIIKSRFFKNQQVLKLSNLILSHSVYLTCKYMNIVIEHPKILQILSIVFTDESYFKMNNQFPWKSFPFEYFPKNNNNITEFNIQDKVDVIKCSTEKVTWSIGTVIQVNDIDVRVAYLYDSCDTDKQINKNSPQLAPYQSKSHTFQWRLNLKVGDLVDVEQPNGNWCNATILQISNKQKGKKNVKVILKVYNKNGNKQDDKGSYFGMSQKLTFDFTSPKLAPYCTVAKQFHYQSNKQISLESTVDDFNDYEFEFINGKKEKYLSEFQFQTINQFGQLGGFDKYVDYLEKQSNFDIFCLYVKGISGTAPYLHRKIVKDLTQRLKVIFEKYLFIDKNIKNYTKQQSQMAFSGLKKLQQRILSNEQVSKYENNLKMRVVDSCLQSEAIKSKLRGLSELKDIVKSLNSISSKNKEIKEWIKTQKIFQKIYITNTHVQLIIKSEDFFKYLITQEILEVTDLAKLYKMAQKGDFQSKVSLYKLFQEVSYTFKKEFVQFLIDTILESDLNLILNEDIDLLHQLSRLANYFPMEKVIRFFQTIILSHNKIKQFNDYAIKKYSEIVGKNPKVKPYRKDIIKAFVEKLETNDVTQVIKVLTGIFEAIATEECGKKSMLETLAEEKIDMIVVQTLKNSKGKPQFSQNFTTILTFLLNIYNPLYKMKVNIKTLEEIQMLTIGDKQREKYYYKWLNQVSKYEQIFENSSMEELQQFYRKLFVQQFIVNMQQLELELAKNFFIQINKKIKYIVVISNNICGKYRQQQKQLKRRIQMRSLRLFDLLILMIYEIKLQHINNLLVNFFVELYTSKDNSQQQIDEFFEQLLKQFKEQYEQKSYKKLLQTIKLIQIVINDSQKNSELNIKSLLNKKQPDYFKFAFIFSEPFKKIELMLPNNISIIRLKKILSKEFNLQWKQIKINSNTKKIQDYDNGRTIKQMEINPNQSLFISQRIIPSQPQQQLILNNQMNYKAVKCFQKIFDKYSTDGKMDSNQCNTFIVKCLNTNYSQKYYKDKLIPIYSKYDDDNDGFLTFKNFLKFYEDASKDRSPTVWSNLRNLGVRGDFKFNDQIGDSQVTKYPRNTIVEDPKVYNALFDLLHVKEIASTALQLLERLPMSKTVEQQLLNLSGTSDLQNILHTSDLYQLFYKVSIIQYLAHSNDLQSESEKEWQEKFIKQQGYEQLYRCLRKVCQIQNNDSQNKEIRNIVQQIQKIILNMLNEYWIECFSSNSEKVRLSLAFISADEEIDDKMSYFTLGRTLKNEKRIQSRPSKIKISSMYSCVWTGQPKQLISEFLLKELRSKSLQICTIAKDSQQSKNNQNIFILISKIIDSINIVYMNEQPHNLTGEISQLLDSIANTELVKKLYCLIFSQCFFATQTKHQGNYIKQLLKNLTKGTIISEHFRVLALLVSKFGIQSISDQGEESEETIKKLKEVLFDSVLNNSNELTVEGCAKLLTNFSLQGTSYEIFEKIWNDRILNSSTICQKQQSKQALFELILKICDNNQPLTNPIIERVIESIKKQIKSIKISSCNQFKQKSPTGYTGLKNLGNICYINSMIQQLYMNENFRYCILRADDQQQPNLVEVTVNKDETRMVDDNFLHQLQRIFANLQLSNRIDFVPKDFCIAYKPFGQSVNVLIQQDVQEFISMFFDRLEFGLSKTLFKKLVYNFYTGKTVNLFKCHECKKGKKVQETFHSISLEVKTSKTLAESFNRFCLGEMISDYSCQFCEKKVDVTKITRISKTPKILIIHLQRIVFNYDTFINQKITTKHSFPEKFNLYESTLEYYEKSQLGEAQPSQYPKDSQYNLIGIIIHSGTAQSGHYISYIKTRENKWIEFNDSLVLFFNPANIELECFGGSMATSSSFDDDFYEEKKQTSKSAYLLIYEKQGANTIQLVLNSKLQQCKNESERQQIQSKVLDELDLKLNEGLQKNEKIKLKEGIEQCQQTQNSDKNTPNIQSHEESSSAPQDSEKQTKQLLQQKELEIRKLLSSQQEVQEQQTTVTKRKQSKCQQPSNNNNEQSSDIVTYLSDPVSPFIPQHLKQEIKLDNEIYYFEKCLSSAPFAKFIAQLLSKPNKLYQSILPIYQKLTLGFWLKSPLFKNLLSVLSQILQAHPLDCADVITNNPIFISLLIETSDAQIRNQIAVFLANVISNTVAFKQININEHPKDQIFLFLDQLFSLLPTTVSKHWIKFNQYFEFWYELSTKNAALLEYMINREIIKHFMDYFLDTKSPLKIYATKKQHQIGSSYTNPNFSMLLKCVFSLLKRRMIINTQREKRLQLSPEQQTLLTSFECLQKLINESNDNIAAQMVKQICPNNLLASEKTAHVLLKGISRSNTDTVQPYLQVLHQYILIEDEYQDLRIKWVVGKQTLAVSVQKKKIMALNSSNIDERIYNYDSSIYVQGGSSLLQPILTFYKRIENFAILLTQQVFKLCEESEKLRKYIFSLESPTYANGKYVDVLKAFIDKYVEESKKYSFNYCSSSTINKEELGKQVKDLYDKVIKLVKEQTQNQEQLLTKQQPQKNKQAKIKCKNVELGSIAAAAGQPFNQNLALVNRKQQKQQIENKNDQQDQNKGKTQIYPSATPQQMNENKKDRENSLKYWPCGNCDDDDWNKLPSQQRSQRVSKRTTGRARQTKKSSNDNFEADENQQMMTNNPSDDESFSDERADVSPIKGKEKTEKQKTNDQLQAWHPFQFQYTQIGSVELPEKLSKVTIVEHESIIKYTLTKPTGYSNKSFTNINMNGKTLFERLLPNIQKNNIKTKKIHGFFVKNSSKDNLRIFTDDGCSYCKANESLFIWANSIQKVWQSKELTKEAVYFSQCKKL